MLMPMVKLVVPERIQRLPGSTSLKAVPRADVPPIDSVSGGVDVRVPDGGPRPRVEGAAPGELPRLRGASARAVGGREC